MSQIRPHAFVAMPFGKKTGPDGKTWVDFDVVWKKLLKPALERAGFEAFRADEERRPGDIRSDMFQELLAADLVLADLTIPNPNVWYELGVRHALRDRGVVLVYGALPSGESAKAFDVYTDRKLRYGLADDGGPDPVTLKATLEALVGMLKESRHSSTRRKVSPVYQLLPHLRPPEWRSLLLGTDNESSATYRSWMNSLKTARRRMLAGDVMVLADETPVRALAVEGHCAAGNALLALDQCALALEQFDRALEIDPDALAVKQKRLVCLGRLDRMDEARSEAEALVAEHPDDAESWALLGRLEKMRWLAAWRRYINAPSIDTAMAGLELLGRAIKVYRRGFLIDPRSHYAGINALTLMYLHRHLVEQAEVSEYIDQGLTEMQDLADLRGAVRYAIDSVLSAQSDDYWALASRAELILLHENQDIVRKAWCKAVPAADHDWFAIDSSLQTVQLLQELQFRPDEVAIARDIIDSELKQCVPPVQPDRVFLFTGHMMDRNDRAKPRFPPKMAAAVAERISTVLDHWGAGSGDLAFSQAAAGGDIIFLEACRARGVRCQVLLPFDEPKFVKESIAPSLNVPGEEGWRDRWLALKPDLGLPIRLMPVELGDPPGKINAYERCNLWLLDSALAHGPEKLHFIALWDGQSGDGPGGTAHLKAEVDRRTSCVEWIDTRTL